MQNNSFEMVIKLLERDCELFSLPAPKHSTTLSFSTTASCNEAYWKTERNLFVLYSL